MSMASITKKKKNKNGNLSSTPNEINPKPMKSMPKQSQYDIYQIQRDSRNDWDTKILYLGLKFCFI